MGPLQVLLGRRRRERLGRLLPRWLGRLLRWLLPRLLPGRLRGVAGTRSIVTRFLVAGSRGQLAHWFSEYWVAASWPKDQTTGSMWPYRYARVRNRR